VFGLPIGLWMISSRWGDHIIKELGKGSGEFGDELRAAIGNNLIIEAKSSVDMLEEKFGYSF